jgi:hypothetical protein
LGGDGGRWRGLVSLTYLRQHTCAVVVPVRYRNRAVQNNALHAVFLFKLSHKRRL